MATTRGRLVQINQVILDQADFFEVDGYTRVTGLTPADLVCKVYFNNVLQSWAFVDGSSTTDAQTRAGSVYWCEVPNSPGIYSVRFRPNVVGYWRLLISYPVGIQTIAQDFDIVPQYPLTDSGLLASFTR